MFTLFNLILVLNIFSFSTSITLFFVAVRQNRTNESLLFSILMLIFCFWSMSDIFLMFSQNFELNAIIFHIIRSITIYTPVLILLIVIYYTNFKSLKNKKIIVSFVLITTILSLFSLLDYKYNFFTTDFKLDYIYHIPRLIFKPLPLSLIFFIHLYLCIFLSLFILVKKYFTSAKYYKKQLLIIIIAISLPALNDLIFWLGFEIIPNYHLITIWFAIGNMFFAYSIFGYNFLKNTPLTRREILENIDEIIISTNSENLVTDMNRSCELFFEINSNDALGSTFYKVFENFTTLVELYNSQENRQINISKHNSTYYFIAKQKKIKTSRNETTTIIILHDITKIKKAEFEIKEREEKIKANFNNSNYGVALLDKEARYIMINPSYTRITGFTAEDMTGKKIGSLIHPDNKETISVFLKLFGTEAKKICEGEVKIINKQGEGIWIYLVANNYINLNGDFEYASIEFNDITERKNAELKLKKYSEELESINATKDKFFSIIAHDLRNPFNGLISLSNLLIENYNKFQSDKIVSLLKIINNSSITGNNLLENLLEWSRLKTNTINFSPIEFSLNRLVNETINTLNINALNKKIKIKYLNELPIKAFADYNMIYSALRNIISNAIKFTKTEGEIIIETVFLNYLKDTVLISVIDNGVGIKEGNLDKIFKIDYKISTKGTSNEPGTGLGLILCKEFIEKNNGKIWIESIENYGTKVFFTLPAKNHVNEAVNQ